MAMSVGTPVDLNSGSFNTVDALAKVNATDEVLVLYDDTGELYGQIATVASGSLVNNTRSSAFSTNFGSEDWDFDRIEDDKHVLVFQDIDDSYKLKAGIITVSSGVPSLSSLTTIDNNPTGSTDRADFPRIAYLGNGTAVVAWTRIDADDLHVVTMDVSGSTVTSVSSETTYTTTIDNVFAMARVDNDRALVAYLVSGNNAIKYKVIDISSGITLGTEWTDPNTYGSAGEMARDGLARVDTDKMMSCRDTANYLIITLSGTTVDSSGTEFSPSNVQTPSASTVYPIDASTVLTAYKSSLDTFIKCETLAVSGTTITENDDEGDLGDAVTDYGIVSMTDTEAILAFIDSNVAYTAYVTGVPAATTPQLRYLGMDADQEHIYISGIEDGTLKLFRYDLSTLTEQSADAFGAIGYTEPDDLTGGGFPVCRPGTDNVLYLYGRDGNNVQVQYNDLNGTLGWQDVGPGTATWGTAKYAVALMPDPLRADDIIVVFTDDDIYTSPIGTADWVKLGDATSGLRTATRHPVRDNQVMMAGTAAGTMHWSPNYGVSDTDAGGTALGTVNWIEVSR